MNILIVDDEPSLRRTLRIALESMGHQVAESPDGARTLELLRHALFDAAFLDLRLAQEQGLDLLPEMKKVSPNLDVIVITAFATIDTAVEAMRHGHSIICRNRLLPINFVLFSDADSSYSVCNRASTPLRSKFVRVFRKRTFGRANRSCGKHSTSL